MSAALTLRRALLALPLVLAACGQDVDVNTQHELPALGAPVPASGAFAQLLQLMVDAPDQVPFEGTRRYEAHWQLDGVDEVLAYREDVFADGRGGYAIDPVDVIEPSMGGGKEALFLLLQKSRESFSYRHRDFGIRDLSLFLAGWQVIDKGTTTLLGRSCARLDVQRQGDPDRVYHLTVDDQNGLILRAEERDLAGELVSLLEFESLNLVPSLQGKLLAQTVTTEKVFETSAELQQELEFVPREPKLVPAGYQLLEIAAVTESTQGGEWARFTYGDGVEELFFLHEGLPAEQTAPLGGGGGKTQAGQAKHAVKYLYAGPWTVLFGDIDGEGFVAIGKVTREELRDLVESAFF